MKKRTLITNPLLIRVALSFIKAIAQLKITTQLHLGKKGGQLLQKLLPKHRKFVSTNLTLCFPEESAEFRAQLANQYFESFGMGLLECCMAGFTPGDRFPSYSVHGLETVHTLIKEGRPIILISAHFATMVMMGHLIAKLFPYACVFRLQRDGTFNSILIEEAAKQKITIIKPKLNGIMSALTQKNKIVLYFVDQDHGARNSIFAPFFGIQTATINALPFLARKTNAAVIPVFCYRKLNPLNYELTFSPPMTDFPSEHDETDAFHINQIIEAAIRKQPELFFWYYKRFRTRPEGQENLYS